MHSRTGSYVVKTSGLGIKGPDYHDFRIMGSRIEGILRYFVPQKSEVYHLYSQTCKRERKLVVYFMFSQALRSVSF
jgi:hypothetical protein